MMPASSKTEYTAATPNNLDEFHAQSEKKKEALLQRVRTVWFHLGKV